MLGIKLMNTMPPLSTHQLPRRQLRVNSRVSSRFSVAHRRSASSLGNDSGRSSRVDKPLPYNEWGAFVSIAKRTLPAGPLRVATPVVEPAANGNSAVRASFASVATIYELRIDADVSVNSPVPTQAEAVLPFS